MFYSSTKQFLFRVSSKEPFCFGATHGCGGTFFRLVVDFYNANGISNHPSSSFQNFSYFIYSLACSKMGVLWPNVWFFFWMGLETVTRWTLGLS